MPLDFGINAGFVEELYAQYAENPESVDPSWRKFFDARDGQPATPPGALQKAPLPGANGDVVRGLDAAFEALSRGEVHREDPAEVRGQNGAAPAIPPPAPSDGAVLAQAAIQARVFQLLNAYRVRGHLYADLDPLGPPPPHPQELDLANFQLRPDDLDKPCPTVDLAGVPKILRLREIIGVLEETYCRSIGVEFTHVEERDERLWLQEQMETSRNRAKLDRDARLRILTKLSEAEIFEQFIQKNYPPSTKRFSCEGAESLIPLCDILVERAGMQGVSEVVMGMAHRGRLNVLVNILDKSFRELFAAFEDKDPRAYLGSGDVKYHLGYSTDRVTASGAKVHLTMAFNPSHLEFVNPVVEGRVRAKQDRLGGPDAKRRVMPILIHGDAAFIGQGVVAETLNLAGLPGYATGGTIHVIVNNQVGFTTNPDESRSTRYSSDITRMLKVPVFHVNGEDPEAVAHVAQLAIDWRQKFGRDVVIDMYCYRRWGHNETDEPRFTQPVMYGVIDKKPTVRQVYVSRLLELGQVTEQKAEEIVQTRRDALAQALDEVKKKGFAPVTHSMGGVWSSYRGGRDEATAEVDTAVPAAKLIELSEKLLHLPEGFRAHPKVLNMVLRPRHERLVKGELFAWDTGEMLAYATLLAEKTPVRISGQDSQRGTFSHRHAVLRDTASGEAYCPLSKLAQYPARFEVYNSPLSENGVLGFDFGYSLDCPDALVVWEAQFGDFLNGAQVIVDQFITSSEDKWHRLSGLVLYLPHGYEGQGPEHSSARLERFLQNCAEDNIQVVNLTTPAQLFHCLRRQVLRPWRKPLVVMTPKSLLRFASTEKGPQPASTIKDLAEGRFQRVIPDAEVDPDDVKRVLLCSGKVYFDLARAREARGRRDVAIVRLEQLYPLNHELGDALSVYKESAEMVWVQEEPKNYGAWYFIHAVLPQAIGRTISCVARAPSASPATGSKASHDLEQKMLLEEAFS